MSLNLYPAGPGAGQLFQRKVTLAERASAAAAARTISPVKARALVAAAECLISLAQVQAHIDLPRFKLGGNQFQLFFAGGYNNPDLTSLVISHLGSAFNGFPLGIYFSNFNLMSYVIFRVAPPGTSFPLSLYGPAQKAPDLFTLSFNLIPGHLEMSQLSSRILGKGGESLLALYNIAREYDIKVIDYAVHKHNLPAMLFYENMGFGEPTDPSRTRWIVGVL